MRISFATVFVFEILPEKKRAFSSSGDGSGPAERASPTTKIRRKKNNLDIDFIMPECGFLGRTERDYSF
jgi:hypothetical protein